LNESSASVSSYSYFTINNSINVRPHHHPLAPTSTHWETVPGWLRKTAVAEKQEEELNLAQNPSPPSDLKMFKET